MSPPLHPRGVSQRGHGGAQSRMLVVAPCPSSSTGRRNGGEKVFSRRHKSQREAGLSWDVQGHGEKMLVGI